MQIKFLSLNMTTFGERSTHEQRPASSIDLGTNCKFLDRYEPLAKLLKVRGGESFRASEALHRMVYRAKRDPESSPAQGGIQEILDSGACPGPDPGFAGMTEEMTFARSSYYNKLE